MIMVVTLWAAVLLYIFPPLWMLVRKEWPVRAGLTMLVASVLPFVVMFVPGGRLTPGAGILSLALIPFVAVALLVIAGGLAWMAFRGSRARSRGAPAMDG